jgi:hypothetical protein
MGPTRLLDLSEAKIPLIITREAEPSGLYGTLNHCWGSKSFLTLTAENIETMKSIIDPALLPKAFQHAIEIARGLSLKYLWIDSLCIVQGLEADWLNESAVMEDVYKHSYCNITATSASNGSKGCSIERDPGGVRTFQIIFPKGARLQDGELFIGSFVVNSGKDIWSTNIGQSPLLKVRSSPCPITVIFVFRI